MDLSVIVPVYNEEQTLARLLDRLLALTLPVQIIAVDDGSTDSSPAILEDYRDRHNIVYLRHTENHGKGAAIVTGLRAAEGVYTVIQDADLEYDPNDIVAMYNTARRHNADAVFGSRIMNPSSGISYRRFYWGGKFLTFLANLLYGVNISDESTCYKLVRTELMKSLNLQCRRFEFCPELVAKLGKRKVRIFEIPIKYSPRKLQEGKKIRWHDGLHAIWTLVRHRLVP
jgi:glycosyltransferase involved in cell wall biosynthesis